MLYYPFGVNPTKKKKQSANPELLHPIYETYVGRGNGGSAVIGGGRRKGFTASDGIAENEADDVSCCHHKVTAGQENDRPLWILEPRSVDEESQDGK